ncbi:MAG: NAD(P)H-dependent oxidoreductase [Candidatus Caldatribacteriota bacterium]
MSKKIVIFTASEQKNLELANNFIKKFTELGAQVDLINMIDLDLPLYSSRTDGKYNAEELLREYIPTISQATGMVFIAPEYNGSTPPSFSNFLAWLSRTSKDWREHLNGKAAAIATFSAGGGHGVLSSMRSQLAFIGMNVLGRQILTHFNKPLDEKSLHAVCEELIKLS